jgi:signal transduction histidine kinase
MAMVQRLVNRHGGRVWTESQIEQRAPCSFTLPGKA